tara:strand:+ start:146 stop:481 length:336 start_codon:yes stop_codon:yes gene_type:complete
MSKFYGATLEPYAGEDEYEDFIYDLEYFNKYIGKEVCVKGYNLNWRGVNGEKVFLFNNIKQIYRELVNTNTDFSFDISKTRGRNTYKATSSNHDCNSRFSLSFRKESDNEG